MAGNINAAVLSVKIQVDSADAKQQLLDMSARVTALGNTAIPSSMQESIANIGSVSTATSRSMRDLAEAQQSLRVDTASASYAALAGKLELAKDKLEAVNLKYGEGSAQSKAAALAVDTLSNKVANANTALTLQRDRLEAVKATSADATAANGLLGNSFSNQATAIAVLTGRIEATKESLKQQKAALDQAKSASDSAAGSTNHLTVEVNALAASGGRISAWGQIVIGALRGIGDRAIGMLPSIGDIIGASADLQTNLNMLQQSSGATADQMGAISERAKQLGSDMSLPGASAAGAVASMLELNKAGLGLNDTLSASRSVLELATAAQMDNAEAATVVAGALNTFGYSGEKASMVVSQLTAGANESASSVQDIANGFANAGATFNLLGQESSDLITTLAQLSNVGLSGAQSGTALNAGMMALAAPTDKAKELMADLGLNIRDASGQMLPMRSLIGELQDKLGGLSPAAQQAALKTLVLGDGLRAFAPLVQGGTSDFDAMNASVTKFGAQTAVAQAQSKGLNGAMEGMRSSLEGLALEAITPLLPLMESAVRGIADMASWLGERAGPAAESFVRGLTTVYDISKTAFDFIRDNAETILGTLGAAAIATAGSMGLLSFSIVGFTQAIGIAIASAATAAISFAAVAIPVAAIAVAVGATIYAIKEFSDGLAESKEQGLMARDAYADARRTIDELAQAETDYSSNKAINEAQGKLGELTSKYDELFGRATGSGGYADAFKSIFDSSEVNAKQVEELKGIEAEMAALNAEIMRLKGAHNENNQVVASGIQGLRGLREGTGNAAVGVGNLTSATGIMGEALDRLNEQIAGVNSKGFDIFGTLEQDYKGHTESMARLQVEYNQATDEKTKKSLQDQIDSQIIAYAQQEQVQRESMGRQLMSLAELEGQKNGLSQAAINDMTSRIGAEYGVMESVTGQAFGGMSASITDWAVSGGKNTADVVAGLTSTSDAALATQQAVSTMAGQYELRLETNLQDKSIDVETFNALMREVPSQHNLTLFENFMDGKLSADEFLKAVNALPPVTTSDINTNADSAAMAANGATKAILDVPRSAYVDFKDNIIAAEGRANDLTQASNNIPKVVTVRADFVGQPAVADAKVVGAQIIAGMVKGIQDNARSLANASAAAATGAIQAAKNAAGIRSPSFVAEVEIGAPIVAGMVRGIERNAGTLNDIMAKVTTEGMQAAQEIALDLGKSQGQQIGDMMKSNLENAGAIGASVVKTQGQVIGDMMKVNLQNAGAYGADVVKSQGQLVGDMMRDNLQKAGAIGADAAKTQGQIIGDMMRDNLEQAGAFGTAFAEATASNLSTIFGSITQGIGNIGAALGNLQQGGWSIDLGGSGGAFGGASTSSGAIGGASTSSSSTFPIVANMTTGGGGSAYSAGLQADTSGGAGRGRQEEPIKQEITYNIYNNMDREIFMQEIAERMERGKWPFG